MCFDIGVVVCGPNEALVISGMFQASLYFNMSHCFPIEKAGIQDILHLIQCAPHFVLISNVFID